jgi:hypothetical protein
MLQSSAATAGLLYRLSACLHPVAMIIKQQQQQQHNAEDWDVWMEMTNIAQLLVRVWAIALNKLHAPLQLLPAVLRTLLPFVQQMQRCSPQLPTSATAADVTVSRGSYSSSSSSSAHLVALIERQFIAGLFVHHLGVLTTEVELSDEMDAQMSALLRDPAVTEMMLQLLAAYTMLLRQSHDAQQHQGTQPHKAEQQSTQQGGAGRSSSRGATSGREQQQDAETFSKQQLRADLLPIPAFHQDVLSLLPGGQAYLEAAAVFADDHWQGDTEQLRLECCADALRFASMLGAAECLDDDCCTAAMLSSNAQLLSAAAIKLMLELQLLAAGFRQHQRQSKQQQHWEHQGDDSKLLLLQCNIILRKQVWANLQATGSSCLPPEVLQQAGLQLLQALAAPLQHLQLEGPDGELAGVIARVGAHAGLTELYMLRLLLLAWLLKVHTGPEAVCKLLS